MSAEVPVKVQVLLLIRENVRPLAYRTHALMEDHYTKSNELSPSEFITILELQAAVESLSYLLDEIIHEAQVEKVETLHLKSIEYRIILELSKVVESSSRYASPGISLRTH